MLTYNELKHVISWEPYREDWFFDRNQPESNIYIHFEKLLSDFQNNGVFESKITQDGGMTNYIEIACFNSPRKIDYCILVCISLCSPYAAYGQVLFGSTTNSFSYAFLEAEKVGIISFDELRPVENEVKRILDQHNLIVIDNKHASEKLPTELAEKIDSLHEGDQLINGLFQWID